MCMLVLHAVGLFMHVYLHAQTVVDEGDIHTTQIKVILIIEKTEYPHL